MVEATFNDSLTSTLVYKVIYKLPTETLQQLQGCYQLKQTSNNTIYFKVKSNNVRFTDIKRDRLSTRKQ